MKRYMVALLSLGLIGNLIAMDPTPSINQIRINFMGNVTVASFDMTQNIQAPGVVWRLFGPSSAASKPRVYNLSLRAPGLQELYVFACRADSSCVFTNITPNQMQPNGALIIDEEGKASIQRARRAK